MRKPKGFTLIELLVVIAIIGLLLAVLIPGLKKAKDLGKRAVCLAHLHSLGISWRLYADAYDSKIVSAKTARVIEEPGSAGGTKYRMVLDPDPSGYHAEWSWAGWLGSGVEDTPEAHKACITLGALYPYCETIKIYRCPEGMRDQWRTYSIVDSMNGHWTFPGFNAPVIKKTAQIRAPGNRMVFLDEGYETTESWTIWPNRIEWWDRVPIRHGEGTCLAMADGHAEYWKWRDKRTVLFAKGLMDGIQSASNNEDFDRIQAAVWTLKYRGH